MSGLSNKEILDKREKLIKKATKQLGEEVSVIESFIIGVPATANPIWFLGEAIKKLSNADVAYFAEGWDTSKGCRVEHLVCEVYGIDIMYENE